MATNPKHIDLAGMKHAKQVVCALLDTNADLLTALRDLADAAEAQARGDDDAVPMHLRSIDSAHMATLVTAARSVIAKAEGSHE